MFFVTKKSGESRFFCQHGSQFANILSQCFPHEGLPVSCTVNALDEETLTCQRITLGGVRHFSM